ncbi:uncharacterized protein AMSG_08615 [Thecamonas trahens ATCC 50062]|uniref:GATA-type domain-containing protein n=1 Tax=Thecamonas trahens ATCC 50062 TaxID=461836 RepID=A0A0L0DKC5_THETB|nr:hypothetical protein AMSG_08615 [Thecamonas trahens ATCC 50062]KNC52737.1 hypothetical protein AMSG_08615 [Thecamonas trahens ATCC 50062]|eukprot:XP_013755051.1 hypothetical protein AMSG_08615 [Thecamonas trahens ATCC 50062]
MVTCANCGTSDTPLWRKGPTDKKLCNACGLHWKSHGRHRDPNAKTPRRSSGKPRQPKKKKKKGSARAKAKREARALGVGGDGLMSTRLRTRKATSAAVSAAAQGTIRFVNPPGDALSNMLAECKRATSRGGAYSLLELRLPAEAQDALRRRMAAESEDEGKHPAAVAHALGLSIGTTSASTVTPPLLVDSSSCLNFRSRKPHRPRRAPSVAPEVSQALANPPAVVVSNDGLALAPGDVIAFHASLRGESNDIPTTPAAPAEYFAVIRRVDAELAPDTPLVYVSWLLPASPALNLGAVAVLQPSHFKVGPLEPQPQPVEAIRRKLGFKLAVSAGTDLYWQSVLDSGALPLPPLAAQDAAHSVLVDRASAYFAAKAREANRPSELWPWFQDHPKNVKKRKRRAFYASLIKRSKFLDSHPPVVISGEQDAELAANITYTEYTKPTPDVSFKAARKVVADTDRAAVRQFYHYDAHARPLQEGVQLEVHDAAAALALRRMVAPPPPPAPATPAAAPPPAQ